MVTEELGFSGAVLPFWATPPAPGGAMGSIWVRLGFPLSLLFLLPSTQPGPLVEGLSWDFSQPPLRGVRPAMKE